MFMRVCGDNSSTTNLALTGFTRLDGDVSAPWKSRILQNRRLQEGSHEYMGIFYSPHQPEKVESAIRCWVGLLNGQTLANNFVLSQSSNVSISLRPRQITSWDLDLSNPKGIELIEKCVPVDADGNLRLPDGSKIIVRRAPRPDPA